MTPVEMKERNVTVSETDSAGESIAVEQVLNRFRWAISSSKAADLHPVGFFDKWNSDTLNCL